MDFGRALGTAFTIGSNRTLKEGETDDSEQVSWAQALIGIAILVVAQLALIFWPTGAPLDATIVRDLSLVSFGALLVPFLVFWIGASLTRTTARLPAAFLYLSIALAVLQVVSGVLAGFGTGQSGFLMGLLLAVTFLGARGFLKVGWVPAIVIAVLVAAGFIGANLLLLVLPTGRLLA
jgi:hypothetical protein